MGQMVSISNVPQQGKVLYMIIYCIKFEQWRIQDFPEEGANPWVWDKNLLFDQILAENCIEIKEIGLMGHTHCMGPRQGQGPGRVQ